MSWRDWLKEEVRSLAAYAPEEVGAGIRLDANESPYPLEAEERAAILEALETIPFHRYPEPGAPGLREAVAHRIGVAPDWVSLGNGSDEFLPILCTVFGRPPPGGESARILTLRPTFSMYRQCAVPLGMQVDEVDLDERFQLREGALAEAIAARPPNLVFLATPNNPTGTWVEDAQVVEAASMGESLVVVDEAYGAFAGNSHLPLLKAHPNLVVLQTLSKVGLAALRLGILVGHPEVVREVDKVRLPYNINALSACAAEILLRRFGGLLEARIGRIVAERERVFTALSKHPRLEVFPSLGNFLLFRVNGAADVAAALREEGVVVRNLDRPGPLAGCLRATVGTAGENDAFLGALSKVLDDT